jgi:Thiol:disulfide interchange protein DsbD, N-terminal
MRLRSSCRVSAGLLAAAAAVLLASDAAIGQFRGVQAASVMPPATVRLKAGQDVSVPLKIAIRPGYHINSNTPAEDYLIPTRLTWSAVGLKVKSVDYPEAETVRYDFSEKPLLVFSGTIALHSVLAVPDPIPAGLKDLTGKLRYQACNEKACLPPVTVDVTVPVTPD